MESGGGGGNTKEFIAEEDTHVLYTWISTEKKMHTDVERFGFVIGMDYFIANDTGEMDYSGTHPLR